MIIGFAGKAGCGKDTAGNYLKLKGWKHYQFARPLKMVVASMLDIGLPALEMREIKEMYLEHPVKLTEEDAQKFMSLCPGSILGHQMANDIIAAFVDKSFRTIREFLQFVGTDIGRDIVSPTLWVDAGTKAIDNLKKSGNIVITDVRFQNECDIIRERGGIVIRLNREEADEVVATHPSEQSLFKVDYTIDNNSHKQALYDEIERILKLRSEDDTKRAGAETPQHD